MSTLNKVILIGNLTKDPEKLRRTPSGAAVTDLRLAINRKFKTADGELKDEKCFVNVSVWGRQTETAVEYLGKGSQVLIEGRLKYDEWEKNGQKQNRLSVVGERIQFLGAPRQRVESGAAPEASDDHPVVGKEQLPGGGGEGDSDDLPF